MNISIVIPLLNEKESLTELINSINEVMKAYSFENEIILIDDGSKDGSWELIKQLSNENQKIELKIKILKGLSFIEIMVSLKHFMQVF